MTETGTGRMTGFNKYNADDNFRFYGMFGSNEAELLEREFSLPTHTVVRLQLRYLGKVFLYEHVQNENSFNLLGYSLIILLLFFVFFFCIFIVTTHILFVLLFSVQFIYNKIIFYNFY